MNDGREKVVKVADLKAHLSEYLRLVQKGHEITVVNRDIPVARMAQVRSPKEHLRVRKPTRDLKSIQLLPPVDLGIDAVQVLLEDRRRR